MENKGIWLPIEIINDKNTTFQEKLILMEISQLAMLDKGCIASNNHFALLFDIKKESVSRCINSLEKKGYINSKIIEGSRNHNRIITINKLLSGGKQNVIDPLTNCSETKENKTKNKTINIFDAFLKELKSKVTIKSKVTKTKDGEELFKQIEDKKKLMNDYINHQLEKKEFAQRITAYMMDYETLHKNGKQNPLNIKNKVYAKPTGEF